MTVKAKSWADARLAVVNLNVTDPSYRQKLNELSEAEDALAAIRALAEKEGET